MKFLNRLILLAGFATMAFLLWHFSPAVIWADVSQIGILGLLAVLPFQIFDHLLNALAWRFAFDPEDAPYVPLTLLMKVRVAGDAVNYLTPSGQIAGELVRPALLGDVRPEQVKNTSVALAKFAQALAQAVFVMVGLLFVVLGHMNVLDGKEMMFSLGGALLVVGLISFSIFILTYQDEDERGVLWKVGGEKIQAIRGQMRDYMLRHPARFAWCTMLFTFGYAWGMLEVMLICHFMGVALDPLQALAVETISNVIDAAFFMVPAKIGTQEAGKTAIFHALGLPATQGLAFGLIRHLRELVWAAGGFTYYALAHRRARRDPPAESQDSPVLLSRAD